MNDAVRWERVREVFGEALASSPEERSALLASLATSDPPLAAEVAALLRAHDRAESFMDLPALHGGLVVEEDAAVDALLGQALGPYRIVELVGSGGMGAVYRAVRIDEQFEKQVAIKIVRRGLDTDLVLSRFKSERRILARLDHPGLARLLDGGTTPDGRPYLVMEYVVGRRIDLYAAERGLDVTQRLALFRQVCAAVAYAHQNLVVHRDIKPANILVTADGTPKLLDFGIAKLIDPDRSDDPTVTDGCALTPDYASPEQLRGEPVTTASDVYSLGVLLFELLTGQRPYRLESRAPHVVARAVCEQEAPRPSSIATESRGALAGDLDTIVLMALRKEPLRRYASVERLSDDLRRHVEGRPVRAQHDTLRYRTAKFMKRNRVGVAAAGAIVLSLVGGIATTAWQARAARRQGALAERRFSEVRRLAGTLIFQVQDAIADIPGSTQAQKLLVTQSLAYLDTLTQDSAGDPGLQRELGLAYARLARVQGVGSPNLGDTDGAVASSHKAIALLTPLAAAAPSDAALQSALAQCHQALGTMLWCERYENEQAMASLKTARKLVAAAIAVAPKDADLRLRLVTVDTVIGLVEIDSGGVDRAIESFSTAVDQGEAAVATHPDDAQLKGALAQAYTKLGDALQVVRDFPRALELYEKARVGTQVLLAKDPASIRTRSIVVGIHFGEFFLLSRMKRSEEAAAAAERALILAREGVAADPSNAWAKDDVVMAERLLCSALVSGSQPARSLPVCRRAVEDARTAASDGRGEALTQGELAFSSYWLSRALRAVGDTRAALDAGRSGLPAAEAALRSAPASRQFRLCVAILKTAVGDALSAHDLDGARDAYHAAEEILEPLVAQAPPNIDAEENLRRLYSAMSALYARRAALAAPGARRQEMESGRAVDRKALDLLVRLESEGAPADPAGEAERLRGEIAGYDAALAPRTSTTSN
jgi:non-specific serine/threonine protein kinase/serine/threonine-protein kinase